MNILVLGSGAREHAICYKLNQSLLLGKLYCAPGNVGISEFAQCFSNADIMDFNYVLSLCTKLSIDLVVVGPEAPLVAGIVDYLGANGVQVFGPNRLAASVEGSKSFMKKICADYRIPTARITTFDSFGLTYPQVIKEDGLASGKGVYIVDNEDETEEVFEKLEAENKEFFVEEFLEGEELSYHVMVDGFDYVALPPAKDYKKLLDNDEGPNTGGMGAYTSFDLLSPELDERISNEIVKPFIVGMLKEGIIYKGVLYFGLMIKDGNPYLLETNCRFGDPEAQVILPSMTNDLLHLILSTMAGFDTPIAIHQHMESLTVTLATEGYPDDPILGDSISGIFNNERWVKLFHSGTRPIAAGRYTSGGRVLSVTAFGTLTKARERAYEAIAKINFRGMQFRSDIGLR